MKETRSKEALCQKSSCHEQNYQRESIEASKKPTHLSTRKQKLRSQSTPNQGQKIERNKRQGSTLSEIPLSSTIPIKRINRSIKTTPRFSTLEQKLRSQSIPVQGQTIERNKKQSFLSEIRLSSTILLKRINWSIQKTLPIFNTRTEA